VVTRGAPNYLIADGAPTAVRPTRGGDAWDARRAAPTAAGTGAAGTGPDGGGSGSAAAAPAQVLLGMPALRQPV
jgi:tRNA-2-methylthio-N6-dimethylallyladenosine synthase